MLGRRPGSSTGILAHEPSPERLIPLQHYLPGALHAASEPSIVGRRPRRPTTAGQNKRSHHDGSRLIIQENRTQMFRVLRPRRQALHWGTSDEYNNADTVVKAGCPLPLLTDSHSTDKFELEKRERRARGPSEVEVSFTAVGAGSDR